MAGSSGAGGSFRIVNIVAMSILAARTRRQDPDSRMDQFVGILIHIVLNVIVRATGRNILRFASLGDRSERAELIVGSVFWSTTTVAAFIGIRSLT